MKNSWCRQEQNTVQQEEKMCTQPVQYTASFHCLVEEWKDCEEIKPQPKETWTFVDQREVRRQGTERNGVLLSASTDA